MALGIATFVITIMLLIISLQLRGIKKAVEGKSGAQNLGGDAGLTMEAWLMEMETRGTDLLARIEGEKAALQQVAARLERGLDQRETAVEPVRPPVTQRLAEGRTASEKEALLKKGSFTRQGLQEAIERMTQRGDSPEAIAKALGLGKEEVQLMLRLQRSVAGETISS